MIIADEIAGMEVRSGPDQELLECALGVLGLQLEDLEDVILEMSAGLRPGADLTARMAELERQARVDDLTGVLNRRHWLATVRRTIDGGERGSVLLCDVDHFKAVNDEFGHAAGDQALAEVARRLSGHGTTGRLGGDEFAVWIPGDADRCAESAAADPRRGRRRHRRRPRAAPAARRLDRHGDGRQRRPSRSPTCSRAPTRRSTRPSAPAAAARSRAPSAGERQLRRVGKQGSEVRRGASGTCLDPEAPDASHSPPRSGRSSRARPHLNRGSRRFGSGDRIGEAARDGRVVALLPQRHDDELAARAVVDADVDEVRAAEVADVDGAALGRRPGALRPGARRRGRRSPAWRPSPRGRAGGSARPRGRSPRPAAPPRRSALEPEQPLEPDVRGLGERPRPGGSPAARRA